MNGMGAAPLFTNWRVTVAVVTYLVVALVAISLLGEALRAVKLPGPVFEVIVLIAALMAFFGSGLVGQFVADRWPSALGGGTPSSLWDPRED